MSLIRYLFLLNDRDERFKMGLDLSRKKLLVPDPRTDPRERGAVQRACLL